MKSSLYLAFQYIWYHKVRTALLVFALSIILFLPFGLKKLIKTSEMRMLERASSTPLIIGANASSTDLVINTLYFPSKEIPVIHYGMIASLDSSGFGLAIPLLVKYQSGRFPIVGTSLEYFQFRNLKFSLGHQFGILGDCVVGAHVAEILNLVPGDSLISSTGNFFDITGSYPLKMHITGILEATNSPDDDAIFTDVKTVWVIMGLGHGHEDLTSDNKNAAIMSRGKGNVEANASLRLYQEITASNLSSFHFHGNMLEYPLTAIIFWPKNTKSSTLLRGRFEDGKYPGQILVPKAVVADLLNTMFRIKNIFNGFYVFVAIAAVVILFLEVGLTIRLRKDEIRTMYYIGSGKTKIGEMIGFEVLIMLFSSGIIGLIFYVVVGFFTRNLIHYLINN